MDDCRFDDLARALASVASRRRFAAGVIGGLLALAGARRTDAACRPAGRLCRADGDCCSGICDPNDQTRRRRCLCPDGTELCGRACVDPTTDYQDDPKHCGACGNRCPRTRCQRATCVEGVCGLEPDPAAVGRGCATDDRCATAEGVCQEDGSCRGEQVIFCLDLGPCLVNECQPATGKCRSRVNEDAVGAPCDRCREGATCREDGSCAGGEPSVCTPSDDCHEAGTCDPATGRCSQPPKPDGSPCNGGYCCGGACRAIDLQTDPRNCGACGRRCLVNETCVGGQCWCGDDPGSNTLEFSCCVGAEGPYYLGVYDGFNRRLDLGVCSDPSSCPVGHPSVCPGLTISTCPSGTTTCVVDLSGNGSTVVGACCPAGSTCDAARGVCLQ